MTRHVSLAMVCLVILGFLSILAAPASVAVAQNLPVDWTGSGGNNDWSTVANWNGTTTANRIYIRKTSDPLVLLEGTVGSPKSDTITGLVLSNATGTTNTLTVGPYASLVVQAPNSDYTNWSLIGNPGTG